MDCQTGTIMNEAELKAIEKRANAADCGPWTYEDGMISWPAPGTSCGETITDGVHEHDHECEIVDSFLSFTRTENGAFIAHARTDVPALIAEVRRLRAVIIKANEVCGNDPDHTSWVSIELEKALPDVYPTIG